MNNGLFKALGGIPQNQQMNPMQMGQQLRANPLQFLSKAGYKVPQNLNDPNAIIQHLMNTGQVSQQRYEQARQMAARFMGK